MSDKNTVFPFKSTINAGGRLLDLSKPVVMGILNTTPDSFFAGSRVETEKAGLQRAGELLTGGASLLDIGAYSSRPGAAEVSAAEETKRLVPLVKAIRKTFPESIISVDTFRASVAEAAVDAGAHIINDISGGELDPEMFNTLGRLRVPYVLMHMRGNPQTMNTLTHYDALVPDIMRYFGTKIAALQALHVHDIILDPGFGFAKTSEQNLQLLAHLPDLVNLGFPVLAGLSRKRMVWETLGIKVDEALNGTTVLNTVALLNGAKILRVHDAKAASEAIILIEKLRAQG